MPSIYVLTATIPAGGSLSGAVAPDGRVPVRITTPAGMQGTALSFEVSDDGATFCQKFDPVGGGAEFQLGSGASKSIDLKPADWMGIRALKVRAGTSGNPTVQAQARTLTLVCVELHR